MRFLRFKRIMIAERIARDASAHLRRRKPGNPAGVITIKRPAEQRIVYDGTSNTDGADLPRRLKTKCVASGWEARNSTEFQSGRYGKKLPVAERQRQRIRVRGYRIDSPERRATNLGPVSSEDRADGFYPLCRAFESLTGCQFRVRRGCPCPSRFAGSVIGPETRRKARH